MPRDVLFNRRCPAVTEIQDVDPNAAIDVKDSSQGPHLPNTYGPCPPGEVRRIWQWSNHASRTLEGVLLYLFFVMCI